MRRLLKKLKGKGGFSLAETLLAVLILLLVSTIVAQGVPAARNVYEKVFIGANAQALLSTTITALRDELGTAWDVAPGPVEFDRAITYFSADTGARSMLYIQDGTIFIQEYVGNAGMNSSPGGIGEAHTLVSAAASTANKKNDLLVSYTDVAIEGDIVKISGLTVKHNDTVIAQVNDDNELQIQVFSVAGQAAP